MAQALFDEHPLEQYLRNAGEAQDLIPGSTAELETELDPLRGIVLENDEDEDGPEWRPPFMIKALEVMHSQILVSTRTQFLPQVIMSVISELDLPGLSTHSSPFAEHFKYDVISSTLLEVSLPSMHVRTPRTPNIPGQLLHSRTSSLSTQHNTPITVPTSSHDPFYLIPSFAFLAFATILHAGYILLALAFIGIIVYIFNVNDTSKNDMTPSLESLNELIASNNDWENVVQEAISILDKDEPSFSYGAATPPSPCSSLRVALHSSLLTTQTQCDNVRQLFSALTLPSELSQLSEMYAPPSPMNPAFSPDGRSKLLSLPSSRRRTICVPSDPFLPKDAKRQTWNGTHSRFGQLGSSPVFQSQAKHRSEIPSIPQPTSPSLAISSLSPPVSPTPPSLPLVSEESDWEYEDAHEHVPHTAPATADGSFTFGAAALALHRKRRTAGMEAFRMPPPSYFSPAASPRLTSPPRTPPTATSFSGSRLTPIHAARHPLSLSALHHALQSALAAKRFACSHLLALRFADEEDEGYWEDVRSVMALLKTTLVDASSRLAEAITEAEQLRLREQNPTPSLPEFDRSMDSSVGAPSPSPFPLPGSSSRRQTSISFAPLPSHVSRFAAHVESISSALDDARENLDTCVAALREESPAPDADALNSNPRRRRHPRATRPSSTSSINVPPPPPPASLALEAYERLRRELGLALRECERGRERLMDVVYPPELYGAEDDGEGEGDSADDVPALGHDGSDESDKPDTAFPFDIDAEPESPPAGYAVVALEAVDGAALDDATAHLLLSASPRHLPPPGIEQVFEADSGNTGVFKRERSKLTREERIKLVKARRESGGGVFGFEIPAAAEEEEEKPRVEKWGPGGEVVQELKDVIWKVGERRRRMADTSLDSSQLPMPTCPTPSELLSDDAPA
ncbi:hypothetical protein H0H92_008061 [Tricholoma furcatifolium]|nr:hypothetical protein H0H92_008061 [Tricholoma furcatifolium]